ncbi:MAG: hypothetical protein VX265_15560 [Myxococcota bacterium]|nr:hypothetical protein [Myxococcota bacterium]
MDRTFALRLLDPLREGSEVSPGNRLESVRVHPSPEDHREDEIRLVFSSSLVLALRHGDDHGAAFRTRNFCVSIEHDGDTLSDADRVVVAVVRSRLEANDTGSVEHWITRQVHQRDELVCPADLWLLPGHIGNPLDLSIRTLRVLKCVDLVLVETGSEAGVDALFEMFALGPTPELLAIDEDEDILLMQLKAALDSGRSVALFGAEEGVPGLCDPGWMVMRAVGRLEPSPVVRTASAGSSLTTALMHADQRSDAFLFVGLFQTATGRRPFLAAVGRLAPWSRHRAVVGLAEGRELQMHWADLARASRCLGGRLTLMANLSRPREYTRSFRLSDLPRVLPDFLMPQDKVVVRVDLDPVRFHLDWVLRPLMRLLPL